MAAPDFLDSADFGGDCRGLARQSACGGFAAQPFHRRPMMSAAAGNLGQGCDGASGSSRPHVGNELRQVVSFVASLVVPRDV